MSALAVLVDHGAQGATVVTCRRRKGQARLRIGRNPKPHRHGADGVKTGVKRKCLRASARRGGRWGCCCHRVKPGQRLRWRPVTTQPALSVRSHPHADHLRVGVSQKMRRLQALLGRQARRTLEQQCLLLSLPVSAHKHIAESRVRFVGTRVGQRDLEGRDQLDVKRSITQVAKLDLPEFDVVFRADPDRRVGLHLAPVGIKAHAITVVGAVVVRRRVRCWMLGDRHRLGLPVPAQVEKTAMRIAQSIVAPACDAGLAPATPASPIGAQRHTVASIRQHMRWLHCRLARHHLSEKALCTPLKRQRWWTHWWRIQPGHLTRCALMQQGSHGFDVGIAHAPALRRAVQQHIGKRYKGHALVVRHESAHRGESLVARAPRGREVQRLDEAIALPGCQRLQRCEVGAGCVRCNQRRQRRGIGRNHQLIGRRAAQRQTGNALRRILVGQRVVASAVG